MPGGFNGNSSACLALQKVAHLVVVDGRCLENTWIEIRLIPNHVYDCIAVT